jgi:nucleotide-binding universal stress UspA family protein
MHVRRILFATDGSPAALQAADKLAFLVRNNQETSISIVAALPQGPILPNAPAPESEAERELLLTRQAQHAVYKTAGVFARWGLPWSGKVVLGDCACTAIAKAADEELCDLIAMSSRERVFDDTGLPAGVNLTDEVMQRAGVPVLVIPP